MKASVVARHPALFATGNGTVDINLNAGGSNRLLVVACLATAGGAQTLNSLTLSTDASPVAGQQAASGKPTNETQHGNVSVYVFTDSQMPSAGTRTLTPTWSAVAYAAYLAWEVQDAPQTADFIAGFIFSTVIPNVATASPTVTLSGAAGKLGLFAVAAATGSTSTPSASNPSANLSNEIESGGNFAFLAGYEDDTVASASEVYSADVDLGRADSASDNIFAFTFAVNDSVAATLTADSITGGTIRAGDTVTIQLSNATNASGKTLSIPQGSITPTAQDINSISFLAMDLKTFGDKTGQYNTNITITVTDGAESDTIDFQMAPDVGDEVGTITALEGIYAEEEFAGLELADVYYTTTITDADFTVGAVPLLETEQVFNLWIYETTSVTPAWGTPFEVTIPASAGDTFASYEAFMDSLTGNGWTDKLIRFLQAAGFTEGTTNAMYEYLKTKSSKLSHSERYKDWKDGGWG